MFCKLENLASSDNRRKGDKRIVDSRVGHLVGIFSKPPHGDDCFGSKFVRLCKTFHQVCLYFVEVDIERPLETEGGCYGRHHLEKISFRHQLDLMIIWLAHTVEMLSYQ